MFEILEKKMSSLRMNLSEQSVMNMKEEFLNLASIGVESILVFTVLVFSILVFSAVFSIVFTSVETDMSTDVSTIKITNQELRVQYHRYGSHDIKISEIFKYSPFFGGTRFKQAVLEGNIRNREGERTFKLSFTIIYGEGPDDNTSKPITFTYTEEDIVVLAQCIKMNYGAPKISNLSEYEDLEDRVERFMSDWYEPLDNTEKYMITTICEGTIMPDCLESFRSYSRFMEIVFCTYSDKMPPKKPNKFY